MTCDRGVSELNLTPIPIEHNPQPNVINVATSRPICNVLAPKQPRVAPKLQVGVWNARSMNNKMTSICDLIIDNELDILVVTESWLRGDLRDDSAIADLNCTLPDYRFCHLPRSSRGGGVGVIYRSALKVTLNSSSYCKSFEHLDLSVTYESSMLRLFAVFRPPPSTENQLTSNMFLREFSSLLEDTMTMCDQFILTGDFNVHVDDLEDREAIAFIDILDSADLYQHIQGPTHKAGHTLDLLISRKTDHPVCKVKLLPGQPSDHIALFAVLDFARPAPSRKRVTYRKLRDINLDQFKDDIRSSQLALSTAFDTSQLAEQFNMVLRELLDKHAPEKIKTVTLRPNAPWYTEEVREAKRVKRRLERKMTKSNLEIDKQLYKEQCKTYQKVIEKSKCQFYQAKISESDDKDLFRCVNKLCSPSSGQTLPDHAFAKTLANNFGVFFHEKVKSISDTLNGTVAPKISVETSETHSSQFTEFAEVSEDTVLRMITKSASTTCDLDPLPTFLLKDCLDVLLPYIMQIINGSLQSGVVPSIYKTAHVKPLIKKQNLPVNDLKNYRPVANLMFTFKVLERVVSSQLKSYLQENRLFADAQSAYRQYHSTETAMLRVMNDLLLALDTGHEAVLVLLDYSAAFDTINHDIFFDRLQNRYGIGGTELKWFKSYLKDRSQAVVIDKVISDTFSLPWGTPQGSVKGPLDFIMYTGPLSDVIGAHKGVQHIIYADDTQVYLVMKSSEHLNAVTKLERCVADVRAWAIANKLMLNAEKTEVLHFHSQHRKASCLPDIRLGDASIKATTSAKDLGVVLDSFLRCV
jgi:hypothetical protein